MQEVRLLYNLQFNRFTLLKLIKFKNVPLPVIPCVAMSRSLRDVQSGLCVFYNFAQTDVLAMNKYLISFYKILPIQCNFCKKFHDMTSKTISKLKKSTKVSPAVLFVKHSMSCE